MLFGQIKRGNVIWPDKERLCHLARWRGGMFFGKIKKGNVIWQGKESEC
jgi:hypothetical protein